MNIIILKLLEVAQPDVTQTTVEILQSDWAATIPYPRENKPILNKRPSPLLL